MKAVKPRYKKILVNGLSGRVMQVSGQSSKEILAVYGHHASLERFAPLSLAMADYGNVTTPDLPGFGGMDSFYKIGMTATIENFADYLATFIKLHYKEKRITIVGFSFGFLVVTNMLSRYPDIAKKVDLVVSVVGFTSAKEFRFTPFSKTTISAVSKIYRRKLPSYFARYVLLNSLSMNLVYGIWGRTS